MKKPFIFLQVVPRLISFGLKRLPSLVFQISINLFFLVLNHILLLYKEATRLQFTHYSCLVMISGQVYIGSYFLRFFKQTSFTHFCSFCIFYFQYVLNVLYFITNQMPYHAK